MNCNDFNPLELYLILIQQPYTTLTADQKLRVCKGYEHMRKCSDCYEDLGITLEDILRDSSPGDIRVLRLNMNDLEVDIFKREKIEVGDFVPEEKVMLWA